MADVLLPSPRMSVEHMLVNRYSLETIERHVRRWAIVKTLNETHGHHQKAAKRLGIHRNTLTRMIQDLQIEVSTNGNRHREVKNAT